VELTLRPELDRLKCSEPGCDCEGEVYLESICHPKAALTAFYRKGELELSCAECDAHVLTVAVVG
jgi:hypothetical protein